MSSFESLILSKVSLFVEVVEEVEEHGGLGLHESVVALVELVLQTLLVTVRGYSQHLSPQTVVLAVRVPKDVGRAYIIILRLKESAYQ